MDKLHVKALMATIILHALLVEPDRKGQSLETKLNEAEGLMEALWERIVKCNVSILGLLVGVPSATWYSFGFGDMR